MSLDCPKNTFCKKKKKKVFCQIGVLCLSLKTSGLDTAWLSQFPEQESAGRIKIWHFLLAEEDMH